ncbi:MAG TPA: transcriptional repressor [Candidatus Omnitrophota bacterium]|nr:transcriptional repressor [Candidatus Omnitrophota bacterium]
MKRLLEEKDAFHDKCRERGLKLTPQRLAIYEAMRYSKEHPSIDMVYQKIKKKFPRISFDTVYRTLITLCDIGLVKPVEGYGYTRRFDPNTGQHHHFHCVKCQKIVDFYDQTYDRLTAPSKIAPGYKILSKKVVVEGLCPDCS